MDDVILITELNDFIFCPISVFFHKLYEGTDRTIYQSTYQINGTKSYETIGQIKEDDFEILNEQYVLKYKKNAEYVSMFVTEILDYKEEIFKYIQAYYRSFMKQKIFDNYYSFELK